MKSMITTGLVGVAFGAALVSANVAASTTLSYGSYVSRSHTLNAGAVGPFFEAVEQETNGSLRFRLHTDGTVVGPRNALSGIGDGVVDMALVVDVYVPSTVPTNATLSELALFPADTLAGAAAVTEMTLLHCEECVDDWHQAGVQPLGFYSTAPYHLMCRTEVKDLRTARGKRVRAATAWAGWTAAMGAVPVNISSGEMYEAMSRRSVDCGLGATAWLDSYGLADVVTHVLDLGIGAYRGGHFMNMNLEKWNGLSDDERAAFLKHLPLAVARAAIAYDHDSEVALENAREKGITIVEPGQDLIDRYDELLQTERERVIETGRERGLSDPEALVDKYVELLEKWEAIVADLDGSEEAFAAELDRHIFQKADL